MQESKNIGEFMRRLKIFGWYLVTEPFRQMFSFWHHLSVALNKTIYWIYYFLIIAIIALMWGQKFVAGIMLIFLLIMILVWEWNSGYFMHRYRQRESSRIQRELNEKEERLMRDSPKR